MTDSLPNSYAGTKTKSLASKTNFLALILGLILRPSFNGNLECEDSIVALNSGMRKILKHIKTIMNCLESF